VVRLRADEESDAVLVPADTYFEGNKIATATVSGRQSGELMVIPAEKVQYIDVSPKQMVGRVGRAHPVPRARRRQPRADGLEHAAAGRAAADPGAAAGGDGLEIDVARHSGMLVRAQEDGTVVFVDAERIRLEEKDKIVREYPLRKHHGLNERTCLNQKPIVAMGQKVKKNQIIADGAATKNGELALGGTCWSRSCRGRGTTSRTPSSSASGW
jgi:DNA-directed RNA polymerase subunit beta